MTSYTPEQERLIASLRSTRCPGCERLKPSKMSFCGACYRSLPEPLKQALYKRIGDGYEEAHAAAMKCLGKKTLTPHRGL